jgi:integral membrane protein
VPWSLTCYRVIAWVVSVLLIVLFCIGLPLDKAAGHPIIDIVVGIAHGVFFYPLYLLATVNLGWRTKMPPIRLLLTLVAGTVPFLSFVAERATTAWVRAERPDLLAPSAASSASAQT